MLNKKSRALLLNKLRTLLLKPSVQLLAFLIAAGFLGNYLSVPFGFGVDFLFGSIAVLIVVSLYGIWWGTIASVIASSYTIALWQHPFALIIFTCETLFVAWRLRQGARNLLLSDMIFWLLIGMPLVWFFYGKIFQVGTITAAIVLVKLPVNGIFNAVVASFILTYKPLYRWANSSSTRTTVFFEQILLNLLVAFVLIPALILMAVDNQIVLKHEQSELRANLETSAKSLASDLLQWHQSGLEVLRQLAETSSQTKIVASGQIQPSLELAIKSLPLFRKIYIINSDLEVIAAAPFQNESSSNRLNFTQLNIPREPKIFVLPSQTEENSDTSQPKILQTLPIIQNYRWLGNIVAELNIDFLEKLLQAETHTLPLESTLLDQNQLAIASTDSELNSQQILNRRQNGKISYLQPNDRKKGVYHWLPIMEKQPLIARWKKSFYGQELLINEEIPLTLVVEAPASSYINYLQLLYIKSLAILLLITLSTIFIAKFLSRLLVQPILNLAKFTTNLPDKLLRHETIELPRSFVKEMNILATNFEVMSKTIEQNIQQIQQPNQELKQPKEIAEAAKETQEQPIANISDELKTAPEITTALEIAPEVKAPPEAPTEIIVNSEIEAKSVPKIIGYKGKRLKVLVVDDVRISRLFLRELLEPLGFQVITAENGQQALEIAHQNQLDIILTDLFMPIRTGFTLVARIRKMKGFEQIPIIAISASDFKEVETQSRAIGCNAFLTKPIDQEKLFNYLEKYQNLKWIYDDATS